MLKDYLKNLIEKFIMVRNKEITQEIKKLYSFGYTYKQIKDKIKEKYNVNISDTTIWRALKYNYISRN